MHLFSSTWIFRGWWGGPPVTAPLSRSVKTPVRSIHLRTVVKLDEYDNAVIAEYCWTRHTRRTARWSTRARRHIVCSAATAVLSRHRRAFVVGLFPFPWKTIFYDRLDFVNCPHVHRTYIIYHTTRVFSGRLSIPDNAFFIFIAVIIQSLRRYRPDFVTAARGCRAHTPQQLLTGF